MKKLLILKKILVALVSLMAILLLILVGILVLGGGRTEETEQEIAQISAGNRDKIDSISDQDVDLVLVDNLSETKVYKMPELALALPDQLWFSQEIMQIIGFNLGLTSKATVENLGQQYVWQEGLKTLVISPGVGLIRLSTAFNLSEVGLPEATPTQAMAQSALDSFLSRSGLATTFYDLGNLVYSYLDMGAEGVPGPPLGDEGLLLRVDIPYMVSGVPMVLPVESYAIIDGEGAIRVLSLLTPNVKETGQMVTLGDPDRARQRVQAGAGILIERSLSALVPDSTGLVSDKLLIDRLFPAYYINMKEFYSMGTRRILRPVYIFKGDQGKVAVLANN